MKKLFLLPLLLVSMVGCKMEQQWTSLKDNEELYVFVENDSYSHAYANSATYKIKYQAYNTEATLTINVVTTYADGNAKKDCYSGMGVSYIHKGVSA